MKKYVKISMLFLAGLFVINGCSESESLEDDFNNANNNQVSEKYIKRFEGADATGSQETILINYDNNNRVTSISHDNSTKFLNYGSNGQLEAISGYSNGYSLDISDFYSMPYDVFDKGEVLEFDSNGNPTKLLVYDGNVALIADIFYDLDKPNPFFHTMKAAGAIEVLDNVDFNIGSINNPELMKARQLINNNIITGAVFKDSNGYTAHEIQFDYTYDEDNYPIYGNVYILESSESRSFIIRYFYK